MTKIKICGLKRKEDIELVNEVRPDYCGFIINFPKSHRSLTPERVRELVQDLDREHVKAVGVFVDSAPELVAELLLDGTLDYIQLHGHEDEQYINRLRYLLETGTDSLNTERDRIIKAFAVKSREDIMTALQSSADYILLDQGQGSGQTFDWSQLTGASNPSTESIISRPWFLAGGLSADNIEEAIRRFHPYAVDLSSSVETDRFKDPEKVRQIVEIVRRIN